MLQLFVLTFMAEFITASSGDAVIFKVHFVVFLISVLHTCSVRVLYVHPNIRPTFYANFAGVINFEGMIFETSQRIKI